MSRQPPLSAISHSGEPVPPGPPGFSEIEGGPHHPGAAAPPGAGPNPSPASVDDEVREDKPTPGASNIPGAGPNPGVSH